MAKQNSKYKKPYIPIYNPTAMTKEQRTELKEFMSKQQAKNNASNHNLRKSQ